MTGGRRAGLRDEHGVSLIELIVGMTLTIVIFGVGFTLLDATRSGANRVTARIEANKIGRPVMARIVDELHSSCVAPSSPPILAGSTQNSMSFVHQTGSAVVPVPVKRTITYDATAKTLSESVYPYVSGAAPTWVFSTTASSTRTLLNPAAKASLGNPAVLVDPFRYYAFVNGAISATPLAVPLSATDAARVSQVTVAFAVAPRKTSPVTDANGTLSFSDTVLFRFDPPGEGTSAASLPCD